MATTRRKLLGGIAAACIPALWFRTLGADSKQAKGFPLSLSAAEWREGLTEREFAVLREHDTEAPGTSDLLDEKRDGLYVCAGCEQPLFDAATKYDSGTGWPSFYRALDGALGTREDRGFLMVRTEVHCSRCGGHQGHVFEDGPQPTGLRYCINGVALDFQPAGASA